MRLSRAGIIGWSAVIGILGCLQPSISDSIKGTASPAGVPIVVQPKGYVPRPTDAISAQGKKYFEEESCSQCHSINNVGGQIGPVLDGIGQRRSEDALYARIADDPAAVKRFSQLTRRDDSHIPWHPRVPRSAARSLVAYLQTLAEPIGGFRITPHSAVPVAKLPDGGKRQSIRPNAAAISAGQKLYDKFGCAQCHAIQHVGGDFAPALDGIGAFRDRDYVIAHINDAQIVAAQNASISQIVPTSMPKFKATPQEIQQIADYLMSLPDNH